MTFFIRAEQERFTWKLIDNRPAATVEKWGSGYYILACPLCGYLHNLPANIKPDASEFKPNCAIAQKVHKNMYHKWLEHYPQAAKFDTVKLILRAPRVIPLDRPLLPVKREIPLLPAAGKAA